MRRLRIRMSLNRFIVCTLRLYLIVLTMSNIGR